MCIRDRLNVVAKLILFIFQGTYQLDESSEAKRPENARQVQQTISLHHAMGLLRPSNHVLQKLPCWRANDTLGQVEQNKFKFGGFL